jgi:hypothetical protein
MVITTVWQRHIFRVLEIPMLEAGPGEAINQADNVSRTGLLNLRLWA